MKATITIQLEDVTIPEIQSILQFARDIEQNDTERIKMGVFCDVPELTTNEVNEMLSTIKPPFVYMSGYSKSGQWEVNSN